MVGVYARWLAAPPLESPDVGGLDVANIGIEDVCDPQELTGIACLGVWSDVDVP
jgi:hypothetical protein